jgi:hypothetical protein
MKKHILLWLLLLPATLTFAQKADIPPTDRFWITGQVAQERVALESIVEGRAE